MVSEQPINIFERLEAREAQATAQRERLWRRAATPLLVIVAIVEAAILVSEGRAVWPLIWIDGRLDLGRLPRGPSSPGGMSFQMLGYVLLTAQGLRDSKHESRPQTATDRIIVTLALVSFGVSAYLSASSLWGLESWALFVGLTVFGLWLWGKILSRKKPARAR